MPYNIFVYIIIPIIVLIVVITIRNVRINSPEYKAKEKLVENNNREIKNKIRECHFEKIYKINDKELGINSSRQIIAYYKPSVDIKNISIEFDIYNFKDIIECEILEDNETILKSGVHRAVVGGIIGGGVGAVIGASSRGSRSVINKLLIRVVVNSILKPNFIITFIDKQTLKTDDYYKLSFSKAQEVYSTLKSIIYNNTASKGSTKDIQNHNTETNCLAKSETKKYSTLYESSNKKLENPDNAPNLNIVQTNSSCIDAQSEIVLLWLISQKKEPDIDNFKITKTVETRYNLNVEGGLQHLIKEKLISNNNGKLIIEESGILKLKSFNCYVIMHLHPEYQLSISDFVSNPQWHIINDNDIIWGIFNSRILQYTKEKMWASLHNNYTNMASMLIEESKYESALDYIFASAFIETSGMIDNNTVTVYGIEISNYCITVPLLNISKNTNLSIEDLYKRYCASNIVISLMDLLPFYYYDLDNACKFMLEAYKNGDTKGIFTEQNLKIRLKKNLPDEKETKKYFYNSVENIVKKKFDA